MPIYEYKCEPCQHSFEMRRGFDEGAEAECPRCSKKARRVFHPAPIIFKGSGFYITDSRAKESTAEKDKKEKTETAPQKG